MQVFDYILRLLNSYNPLISRKRMKIRMIFMALAALLCLASCSDD